MMRISIQRKLVVCLLTLDTHSPGRSLALVFGFSALATLGFALHNWGLSYPHTEGTYGLPEFLTMMGWLFCVLPIGYLGLWELPRHVLVGKIQDLSSVRILADEPDTTWLFALMMLTYLVLGAPALHELVIEGRRKEVLGAGVSFVLNLSVWVAFISALLNTGIITFINFTLREKGTTR